MRRRLLLSAFAMLLAPVLAEAQLGFFWLQFLEPVATAVDLPSCAVGSVEENRARVVQGPSTPSIWYCPVGGGDWVELTAAGGGTGDVTAIGDCLTGDCFTAASPDASLTFDNATSGTVTLQTVAGALGAVTISLPAATGTVSLEPDDTGTDDQAAAEVPFTPAGGISATDTQAAVEEVEADAGAALTAHGDNPSAHHAKTTDAAELTAGVLPHERGGLEADVSAFGGLVRIAGGSTSAVSDLAGLNTALGSTLADGAHFIPDADPGVDHASYVAGHGDGTDCDPGEYARGVDGAGNAELCTADADTTCLDAGVACLFAGSASEGGAASSVAADAIGPDQMADADHGDVSWSGGSAAVDPGAVGITELGDDASCTGSQVVRRNAGDTAFECAAGGGIGGSTGAADNAILRADGTGGQTLQASTVAIDDAGRVRLPQAASLCDVTLGFVDGDTGIHADSTSEDILQVCTDGTRLLQLGTRVDFYSEVRAAASNGPRLPNSAASATNPTLQPSRGDTDTGIGWGGADDLRLIAGGMSGLGQTATESTLYVEQVNAPFARTCTDSGDINPGTLAAAVSGASKVEITNNDPHGCTVTLSESGATRGQTMIAIVIATAGGTVDFPDTAGVQEAGLGCSLGINGVAVFHYATTDRWIKQSCEASN